MLATIRLMAPCLILAAGAERAAAPAAPPKLTAEQQEKLNVRDRLEKDASQLQREGKLAEARATVEKLLKLEQEVFGEIHEDPAGSLAWLTDICTRLEDFPAAREYGKKALAACTQLYGRSHWRTTDARLGLADVEFRFGLSNQERADLDKADHLNREGVQLYRRGEFAKAEALYLEALRIHKGVHGEKRLDFATVLNNLAHSLQQRSMHAKAEVMFVEDLQLRKEVLGENHPRYLQCLGDLALFYEAQGDGKLTEARAVVEKMLSIQRELYGELNPAAVESLERLSALCVRLEDFPAAREYGKRFLAAHKRIHGELHWKTTNARLELADVEILAGLSKQKRAYLDTAERLSREGNALVDHGEYAKAEPLYTEALRIRREVLGDKHPYSASSVRKLALLYYSQGSYAKAEPLFQEALRIDKEIFGEKHPNYADTLNNLAALYAARGLHGKAVSLYEEALRTYKEIFGEKHADYANALTNLGTLHQEQGLYEKAELLFQEALRIRKEVLGDKHLDYAHSLNNLAVLYVAQGLYAKAEPLHLGALRIRKEVLGEKHPAYATSLSNLGSLYEAQGLYTKAEPLIKEALRIRKESFGEKHPHYVHSLNSLAFLYFRQGLYTQAEPYYVRAVRIRKEILGDKHPDYALSLNNLAGLYDSQGLYAKAEPLHLEALRIRKEVLGEKHPDYAASLVNLGSLYYEQGLYVKAEPLFTEALRIRREVLGEKHPAYAKILNNLAALYNSQKIYAKAKPLYEEAVRIHKEVLGAKHPDYATSLNNLAVLYSDQGSYAKAEPLYLEALQIRKEALGTKHPDYAHCLSSLAVDYGMQGLFAKSEPLLQEALRIIEDHLEQTAAIQSEADQLTHAAAARGYLNNLVYHPNTVPADVYSTVFRWRGAVTARQMFARAARGSDPSVRQTVEELRNVSQKLSHLVVRMPKLGPTADVPRLIKELNEEREVLEKTLAVQSKDFAKYRENRALTPADLRKLLPADAALVDFFAYENKIAAFIITRAAIVRVNLLGGKELAELVENFTSATNLNVKRPITEAAAEKSGSKDIRKVVWEPLVPHLKSAKLVLICPDGPLCQLPFGALRGHDPNKYLIEEVALAVVPVPRLLPELLGAPAVSFSGPPSLLLVGDVDFNANAGAGKPSGDMTTGATAVRGPEAWKSLDGTVIEITKIQAFFRDQVKEAIVKPLRKAEATQAAFRRTAGACRYLHLATHGQFIKQSNFPRLDSEPGSNDWIRSRVRTVGVSAGVLSGLVFAGANRPTPEDAGVLSALEIAELDLSGVELAVLSACETGLGDVAGGEGVLGLQRAFLFAGARATMTSLWEIPDGATAPLMVRFYENRLQKRMPALEALRDAQLWVLNEGVAAGVLSEAPGKGRRTPPLYWAAFVLAGDWR